jgi:hypothetical protein
MYSTQLPLELKKLKFKWRCYKQECAGRQVEFTWTSCEHIISVIDSFQLSSVTLRVQIIFRAIKPCAVHIGADHEDSCLYRKTSASHGTVLRQCFVRRQLGIATIKSVHSTGKWGQRFAHDINNQNSEKISWAVRVRTRVSYSVK